MSSWNLQLGKSEVQRRVVDLSFRPMPDNLRKVGWAALRVLSMSTLLYAGLYRLKEPSAAACTSSQILNYVHHKNAHEGISVSLLIQSSSLVIRASVMILKDSG